MKTSADYLDDLRKELSLKSDYAIAKLMGTSTARISSYRLGKHRFDDPTSVWVAEQLKISPFVVIAHMRAERAKDAAERTLWERLAEKAMGIAPAAAGAVVSSAVLWDLLATSDAYGISTAGFCILCKVPEEERAAIEAQLRELGIEIQPLSPKLHEALAEAERLTGGRRQHFEPRLDGKGGRPYDPKPAQGQIELDTAA